MGGGGGVGVCQAPSSPLLVDIPRAPGAVGPPRRWRILPPQQGQAPQSPRGETLAHSAGSRAATTCPTLHPLPKLLIGRHGRARGWWCTKRSRERQRHDWHRGRAGSSVCSGEHPHPPPKPSTPNAKPQAQTRYQQWIRAGRGAPHAASGAAAVREGDGYSGGTDHPCTTMAHLGARPVAAHSLPGERAAASMVMPPPSTHPHPLHKK